jgi:CheY-like chemotaxis protein
MPHLLLVDDDDLFRESLGLNLVDEGYEVTSFANGQDALSYLDRGSVFVEHARDLLVRRGTQNRGAYGGYE